LANNSRYRRIWMVYKIRWIFLLGFSYFFISRF